MLSERFWKVVCDAAAAHGDVIGSVVFILFILTCKLSFETNVSLNHFRRWQFKLLFAFTIQA